MQSRWTRQDRSAVQLELFAPPAAHPRARGWGAAANDDYPLSFAPPVRSDYGRQIVGELTLADAIRRSGPLPWPRKQQKRHAGKSRE